MKKTIQSGEEYLARRFNMMDSPADAYKSRLEKKMHGIIDKGYYQISRRSRTLACLPKGKTGMEALLEATKDMRPDEAKEWVEGMGEGHAGDHFLRCHAKDGLTIILTEEEFHMFRKLGGGCYAQKCAEREHPEWADHGEVISNAEVRIRKRLRACQ
jgi:hypothetical protein